MYRALSVALLLWASGCADGLDADDVVLEIENASSRTAFFAAFDEALLARIDLFFDVSPSNPNRLAPGETVALTVSQVGGLAAADASGRIVLYWWRSVPMQGAPVAAEITHLSLGSVERRVLGRRVRIVDSTDADP